MTTHYTSTDTKDIEYARYKITPKEWGPIWWEFINVYVNQYPEVPNTAEQEMMFWFLSNLSTTLPCEKCREHYAELIANKKQKLQNAVRNRVELWKFVVDIHNEINKRLGKPIQSYDKAYHNLKNTIVNRRKWTTIGNTCGWIVGGIGLVFIIIAIGYFVYNRKK